MPKSVEIDKRRRSTRFVVTEKYAGKKELKDILVELLYHAYIRNDAASLHEIK